MTFIEFACAHGVEIDSTRLCADERIRRCGTTQKPRSCNGAYFWDGKRGWVFNWSTEARVQWFNDSNTQPWTEAEKDAWTVNRQTARAHRSEMHCRAVAHADEIIRSTKAAEHDYLIRKGFPEMKGAVDNDGNLVIPMRELKSNALVGAQIIHWDEPTRQWVKKMLPGMKAKGAVLRLGDRTAVETFLVEGFATGLSVVAALRCMGLRTAVLICFSASNLVYVAPQVRGRAFVFADHDKSGVGEAAAKASGLPYCMSPIQGEDANDLHMRSGIVSVCQLLMRVRTNHGYALNRPHPT